MLARDSSRYVFVDERSIGRDRALSKTKRSTGHGVVDPYRVTQRFRGGYDEISRQTGQARDGTFGERSQFSVSANAIR